MVITYHGLESFKVQFGDTVLAFNPISKDSKLKTAKFGADIALISMHHPDMNGAEQVSFGDKKAFVIEGPGEYESKGIFVKGFDSGANAKGLRNTIYSTSLEDMNLVFLGALAKHDLSSEIKGALPDIDILFVPIGGGEVLSASEAYKLAVSLEPKLIVPMHYDDGKDGRAALNAFLKEAGEEKLEAVEKLTLKRKDLEGKEGDVVVFSSQTA